MLSCAGEPLKLSVGSLRENLRCGEIMAERHFTGTLRRRPKATLLIKRICISAIIALGLTTASCSEVLSPGYKGGASSDDSEVGRAFNTKTSNVQVEGEGVVKSILSDDLDGSRHQRFVILMASGQTILIAHNIDLAPRVAGLQEGDSLGFYGEYVWNSQGGKVHWTHHDPQGRHLAGWLKHNGRTHQ